MDLFPTFVRLAGGTPPKDRELDGRDISGVLLGKGRRDGDEFFYFMGQQLQAVRSGPWKLKRPFDGPVYGKRIEHAAVLFNLEEDPGEKRDVAGEHNDIVHDL
jgi:arylsulfatase A-like enzyme